MLYIVGFGPGNFEGMTVAAQKAIEASELIVGYTVYAELMEKIFPEKEYYSTPMRQEKERVMYALEQSLSKTVSVVCSGDSVIYAMAGLAYELAEKYFPDAVIETVPGVTAAVSGSAVLGAPLTADFAVISLSDLLTPWKKIEKRIECAAIGDMTTVIYNPSSKKRADHLQRVCDIFLKYRSPDTVCGYVKNIGREGQEHKLMTISELRNEQVDMFTTVFIGSSETKEIQGKMVTPRGYRNE